MRPKLISSRRGLSGCRFIELRFWPLSPKVFHRVRDTGRKKARLPPWMITLVAIFFIWEAVALLGIVSSDQLPPLHNVLLTLVQLGGTPFFLARVGQAFVNVAARASLALVVGLPLALLV